MIDYTPFWKTLERSEENWYTLTKRHHVSDSTLHRLKHNKDVSMKTVNDLCRILLSPAGRSCDLRMQGIFSVPGFIIICLFWDCVFQKGEN